MPAAKPTILATSMGFNRAHSPWRPSPIFDYAFELAGGHSRPRLCFISTGTGDRSASIGAFHAAFDGSKIETSHLALFDKPYMTDTAEHLHGQDVIWVDRGSVINLLAVWRAHGLNRILRNCWKAGVVLGGESAGSLCWFRAGTTDAFGDVQPFTDGLGFLPYANAVHYGDRRQLFQECVRSGELPGGYATDAGAGLHFEDAELVAAVSDRSQAGAYEVARQTNGEVREEALKVARLR